MYIPLFEGGRVERISRCICVFVYFQGVFVYLYLRICRLVYLFYLCIYVLNTRRCSVLWGCGCIPLSDGRERLSLVIKDLDRDNYFSAQHCTELWPYHVSRYCTISCIAELWPYHVSSYNVKWSQVNPWYCIVLCIITHCSAILSRKLLLRALCVYLYYINYTHIYNTQQHTVLHVYMFYMQECRM